MYTTTTTTTIINLLILLIQKEPLSSFRKIRFVVSILVRTIVNYCFL